MKSSVVSSSSLGISQELASGHASFRSITLSSLDRSRMGIECMMTEALSVVEKDLRESHPGPRRPMACLALFLFSLASLAACLLSIFSTG